MKNSLTCPKCSGKKLWKIDPLKNDWQYAPGTIPIHLNYKQKNPNAGWLDEKHKRVGAVKGQALPAWDPRPLKAAGVTYCTSAMGADHTAGLVVIPQEYGCRSGWCAAGPQRGQRRSPASGSHDGNGTHEARLREKTLRSWPRTSRRRFGTCLIQMSSVSAPAAPTRAHDRRASCTPPAYIANGSAVAPVLAAIEAHLLQGGFDSVDYAELRDADSLAPLERDNGKARLFVAARIGGTRLIDNMKV